MYSSETINDVIEVDLNEIENDINENEAFISSLKNDDIYKIQVAAFISNFKANKNSFLGSSNESKQARKQLLDSWINFKKTYFNILNENNLGTSEMQEEIDKSKQILNKLIQLANMTQGILDKFESRINDLGTKYSTFINDPTKTVDELKEFTKTFKESVDELEKEFNKEISKSTSNIQEIIKLNCLKSFLVFFFFFFAKNLSTKSIYKHDFAKNIRILSDIMVKY
ncbi:hypothetical protein ONA22_01000 [Mycoplasmopsis cynos]|uniref:hypothetical protein n=1 Tax=Mycoplasmopsis cynos TaxID=171284 RepID=UPI0024C9D49B|nr:hypothetical protein [Mycoplasmopsis cynos]WAM03630.1 hypothetical protein ONA22_01000 [Mycoplasmopsis cynos]